MSEIPELPDKMPQRPAPIVTTRIPHIFSPFLTLLYALCSAVAFFYIIAYGFGVKPPWFFILSCMGYTFITTMIIANGRIEANREAREWIKTMQVLSERNKRMMN